MLGEQHSMWNSNETLLYSKVEGRLSSELPMCAMARVSERTRAHTYTHVCTCTETEKEGRTEGRNQVNDP